MPSASSILSLKWPAMGGMASSYFQSWLVVWVRGLGCRELGRLHDEVLHERPALTAASRGLSVVDGWLLVDVGIWAGHFRMVEMGQADPVGPTDV